MHIRWLMTLVIMGSTLQAGWKKQVGIAAGLAVAGSVVLYNTHHSFRKGCDDCCLRVCAVCLCHVVLPLAACYERYKKEGVMAAFCSRPEADQEDPSDEEREKLLEELLYD